MNRHVLGQVIQSQTLRFKKPPAEVFQDDVPFKDENNEFENIMKFVQENNVLNNEENPVFNPSEESGSMRVGEGIQGEFSDEDYQVHNLDLEDVGEEERKLIEKEIEEVQKEIDQINLEID